MRALPFILVLMLFSCGQDPETVTEYVTRDVPAPDTTVESCPVDPTCELIVGRLIEQGKIKRRKWERLNAEEICQSLAGT